SNICSFNLKEVCETAVALIRDPDHDISQTLIAPDFPGGGDLIYDRAALEEIYRTGRGSFKVRGKYRYDKESHCLEIYQIPPTTTVEAIIDKIVELVRGGKIKEISDIRDETDKMGLKIAIDLKRGVDADALMATLYRMTTLEDSFAANFNVLIGATPMVLGVGELLSEWTAFRLECVKRRIYFELKKRKDLLHLLTALEIILLDIDTAIRVVRETENDAEVVPNLMVEFGIDKVQAEYVAEIKLRHLNREYILRRTAEIGDLKKQIAELEADFKSPARQKNIIVRELEAVASKYGSERKTTLIEPVEAAPAVQEVPDYPVTVYLTRENYIKKLTDMAVKNASEHKLKDGDEIVRTLNLTNSGEILALTDRFNAYKLRLSDIADGKSSVMGEYLPAKMGLEDGESIIFVTCVAQYTGSLLFFFENGKAAKVSLESYATKTNRKKLINAYSSASRLMGVWQLAEGAPQSFAVYSTDDRCLVFDSDLLEPKSTRDTIGVNVISLKTNQKVKKVKEAPKSKKTENFRVFSLPRAGTPIKNEQLTLI
ncbi:MAG: topoisomerase IV, partial [Clostridia bacterium]|nr:topoisomerase IV [Clostridia bacterium]